ncbi:hypothetical protein [Curtobacterium sp. L1-20]|uniref:hypothetical protein n=1 Tax=Curtobacterium sp. L1-20 TaxID=3138181 RepID=UPI003B52EA3B
MVDDVVGGAGWIIRGKDLRPEITDVGAFRQEVQDDPLGAVLELLWTGRPDAALQQLRRAPQSARVRALTADCHRDLGDAARAVRIYDDLVDECLGTALEAVMRQHRGKVLLAAGEPHRAIADFAAAVRLRQQAAPELLASAKQGHAYAQALGHRPRQGPPTS